MSGLLTLFRKPFCVLSFSGAYREQATGGNVARYFDSIDLERLTVWRASSIIVTEEMETR
jgi:hypothetical protein